MKPHHDFTAERPVARHAAFGDRSEAQVFDPGVALDRLAQRLAVDLPEAIGGLGADTAPEITTNQPRQGVMRELLSRGASPCSHGFLSAGDGGPQLLVSIDTAGALQLVDMAFGGDGKLPDPVPEKLPLSAQLLIARIEAQLAERVARIARLASADDAPAFTPLRRNTDIAALRPFAADRALWQTGLEIAFGDEEAWSLRLTMAAEHAPLLCGSEDEELPSPVHRQPRHEPVPAQHAFGDIPLPLRATLVDMRIPLARIAALKPGDVLPVSVARQVPLAIGDATIAHGAVGEVDDRVALQITNAFPFQENPS